MFKIMFKIKIPEIKIPDGLLRDPTDTCLLKVRKPNQHLPRSRCEMCSKLTIKTPERRHWRLYC